MKYKSLFTLAYLAKFNALEVARNIDRQDVVELESLGQSNDQQATATGDNSTPYTVHDLYSGEFSYKTSNAVDWKDQSSYFYHTSKGIYVRNFNENKGDDFGYQDTLWLSDDKYYKNLSNTNGYEICKNDIPNRPNAYYIAYFHNYVKRWRHSGYFSADVLLVEGMDSDGDDQKITVVHKFDRIRYFKFRPGDVNEMFTNDSERQNDETINTFVVVDINNTIKVCNDPMAPCTQLSEDGKFEEIFQGVPDWVYEEEGVASDNAIYWSPQGNSIGYTVFYDADVENFEYMTYGGHGENSGSDKIYSRMENYKYPKAGSSQTDVKCVIKIEDSEGQGYKTFNIDPPRNDMPAETGDTTDITFGRMDFLDNHHVIITWLSRIQNTSVSFLYHLEDDHMIEFKIEDSERSSQTGWLQTYAPVVYKHDDDTFLYFVIESNDEGFKNLYEYKIEGILTHIFSVTKTELTRMVKQGTDEKRALVSLKAYHQPSDRVWFTAAAYDAKDRHIFSVPSTVSVDNEKDYLQEPWCVTCDNWKAGEETGNQGNLTIPARFGLRSGQDRLQCLYANIGLMTETYGQNLVIGHEQLVTVTCYGPDVPFTVATKLCDCGRRLLFQNYFNVLQDNYQLEENYFTKRTVPSREFALHKAETQPYTYQYEIWKPQNFDETKLYPVIVDIYAGPGSQAVTSKWSLDITDHVMLSQENAVVLRVDTRGSGNAGDKLMHEVYKIVGQLEKVDITDFVNEFSRDKAWIDKSKIAIWGWSFGGYATSHVATYNKGAETFTCAVAVAPLTARIYYDTLWSEITMGLPSENMDNYLKGEPWNSEIEAANNLKFTFIHGLGDDNVHFQNSARMNTELIKAGVDFNSYFYADEAHSINYGKNAKEHVYKLVNRKIHECFEGEL